MRYEVNNVPVTNIQSFKQIACLIGIPEFIKIFQCNVSKSKVEFKVKDKKLLIQSLNCLLNRTVGMILQTFILILDCNEVFVGSENIKPYDDEVYTSMEKIYNYMSYAFDRFMDEYRFIFSDEEICEILGIKNKSLNEIRSRNSAIIPKKSYVWLSILERDRSLGIISNF